MGSKRCRRKGHGKVVGSRLKPWQLLALCLHNLLHFFLQSCFLCRVESATPYTHPTQADRRSFDGAKTAP
jgi:hypothetical protein